MGPLAAIPRIPSLLTTMWQTAAHLAADPPDLLVLVDFGAFNMRLAQTLRRRYRYEAPILYLFPPAAWLDNEARARMVADLAVPLPGFARQYHLYKRLGLPVVYFGHPLAPSIHARPSQAAPPRDGGLVAILPGSRGTEIAQHGGRLLDAFAHLRSRRPFLRARIGAADERAHRQLTRMLTRRGLAQIEIVRGAPAALSAADAAWIASGTAVLEAALIGVPSIALYVISPLLVRHARKVYRGEFITLPNLVLERRAIPEVFQADATPKRLATELNALLDDPRLQLDALAGLREALGPSDALDRCAEFSASLATIGRRAC